jgi:hypothetical protein
LLVKLTVIGIIGKHKELVRPQILIKAIKKIDHRPLFVADLGAATTPFLV